MNNQDRFNTLLTKLSSALLRVDISWGDATAIYKQLPKTETPEHQALRYLAEQYTEQVLHVSDDVELVKFVYDHFSDAYYNRVMYSKYAVVSRHNNETPVLNVPSKIKAFDKTYLIHTEYLETPCRAIREYRQSVEHELWFKLVRFQDTLRDLMGVVCDVQRSECLVLPLRSNLDLEPISYAMSVLGHSFVYKYADLKSEPVTDKLSDILSELFNHNYGERTVVELNLEKYSGGDGNIYRFLKEHQEKINHAAKEIWFYGCIHLWMVEA